MSRDGQTATTVADSATTDSGNALRRIATAAAAWLRTSTAYEPSQQEVALAHTKADEIPINDWNPDSDHNFGHWREFEYQSRIPALKRMLLFS